MKHLVAYATRMRADQTKTQVAIGTAIENRDGSISLRLDMMPKDGSIILRAEPEQVWAGHEKLMPSARAPAPQPPPKPTMRTERVIRGADGRLIKNSFGPLDPPYATPEEERVEAPPADAVKSAVDYTACFSNSCRHKRSEHEMGAAAVCEAKGCDCTGFEGVPF